MQYTTKTLNPLPFNSLDPHRFEDLIRQLFYDFRHWSNLDPVGKLGNDDGIDIRGYEWYLDEESDEEESDELPERRNERLWIIQCKREKNITPKKMTECLKEIFLRNKEVPYGFIFAACCEFSKKTHDVFREFMLKKRVQEFSLWGKSSIEDKLFLPKNDHLLFAYFGISLQIKKRSIRQNVRSKLAIKKKVTSILGASIDETYKPVLIRDVADFDYPDPSKRMDKKGHYKWFPAIFIGQEAWGIVTRFRTHYAYVNEETKEYDFIDDLNTIWGTTGYIWHQPKKERDEYFQKDELYRNYCYQKIPEKNRATLELYGLIKFKAIVDIDKDGDRYSEDPHVYAEFVDGRPFDQAWGVLTRPMNLPEIKVHQEKRTRYFPKKIPKVKLSKRKPVTKEELVKEVSIPEDKEAL